MAADRRIHEYPVDFSASGSEYFRIWIVNMLLTLVTLGLYYPWAKVRKLQYFYSCTWVDGHAFDFHGNPRKMLRGTLIAGGLFFAYSQSGHMMGPIAVAGALLVVVLFPFLFRASQRFRMANTSWRGLRFRFTGTVQQAYRTLLAPMAWILLPSPVLLWMMGIRLDAAASGSAADMAARASGFNAYFIGLGVSSVLLMLALPYFFWRFKKYQHGNIRYGQEQMEFRATAADYYRLGGQGLAGTLIAGAVVGAVVVVMYLWGVRGGRHSLAAAFVVVPLLLTVLAVLGVTAFKSWMQVQMFNLQWSRTGNNHLRLKAELPFRPYLFLQIRNYLLILVTLGLYWPFAVVATKRMALESMVLRSRIALDSLRGSMREGENEALGDAAMDFMDFDFGI